MPQNNERGSVLLLVVWILIVVSIIASFMIYRMESEWAVAVGVEERRNARQLAETVLNEWLQNLAQDEVSREYDDLSCGWYSGGRIAGERDGYQVTVIAEDEGSKANLNWLGEKGLQILCGENIPPDAILDWRDSDNETRENGAESAYYESLSPAYKARNGLFSTVTELRQLKEADAFYDTVAPTVTVYSNPNINTIGKDKEDQLKSLLLALGIDPSRAEKVANQIANRPEKKQFRNFKEFKDYANTTNLFSNEIDQLRPFFTFAGSCNLNFISPESMGAILKDIGCTDETVKVLKKKLNSARQGGTKTDETEKPAPISYQNQGAVDSFFKDVKPAFRVSDYFVTRTRCIRYRIWLVKGARRFYLETVVDRSIHGGIAKEWRIRTLFWQFLSNQAVPEIPEEPQENTAQKSETAGPDTEE